MLQAEIETAPPAKYLQTLQFVLLLNKHPGEPGPSGVDHHCAHFLVLLIRELRGLQSQVEDSPATKDSQMVCLVVPLEQQSCHFGPLRADEQLSGPSLLVDLVLVSFQCKV